MEVVWEMIEDGGGNVDRHVYGGGGRVPVVMVMMIVKVMVIVVEMIMVIVMVVEMIMVIKMEKNI